jgi:3D (Asp-Asp-Asp) domain-containing protein
VGDLALIYSTNGDFLGIYEVTDTGGTDGLKAGTVIDVWFDTYEECEEWMRLTEGKCYVQWVHGEG